MECVWAYCIIQSFLLQEKFEKLNENLIHPKIWVIMYIEKVIKSFQKYETEVVNYMADSKYKAPSLHFNGEKE